MGEKEKDQDQDQTIDEKKVNLSDLECPINQANIFSRLTFTWMDIIFRLGYSRPLEETDMWKMDMSKGLATSDKLEAAWKQEVESGVKPSLFRILRVLLWKELFALGVMRLIADVSNTCSPLLLQGLVNFVSLSKLKHQHGQDLPPLINGFYFAGGMFLISIGSSLLSHQFFQLAYTQTLAIRASLYSVIFKKSTRISALARQNYNSGKVTNIISTDVGRIENFFLMINSSWTAPIQIIFISSFLLTLLGPAALAGIGLLVILGPLQKTLMQKLRTIRKTSAPITDSRVKLTQEILEGIRVIKYFTWELPFKKEVEKLRDQEVKLALKRSLIQAFVSTIAFAVPVFASSISFVIFSLTYFASLALFGQLRFPLMVLPMILASYADFQIAIERSEGLLLAEELGEKYENVDSEFAVDITNGEFVWDSEPPKKQEDSVKPGGKGKKPPVPAKVKSEAETLNPEELKSVGIKNINIKIPKGKLVAIVGAVGSGKSTLLNSLIGETRKVSGEVKFSGSIGYAPQQAWIQNASVKDNILFGHLYEEERYINTIRVCALEKDLQMLSNGDATQIGERGINLSGGQKQRINIARLVYFDPDIVLLDDPLSAVDSHVGRYLFEECLQNALKKKTRILVTHQLHFLPQVDYILVMNEGQVAEQGTFEELMNSKGAFSALMSEYGGVNEVKDEVIEDKVKQMDAADAKRIGNMLQVKAGGDARELMQKEDRATGSVKANIWLTYMNSAGGWFFGIGLFTLIAMLQACNFGNSLWLVVWTNQEISSWEQKQYIAVYIAFGVANSLFTYSYSAWMAFAGVRAAKLLHKNALDRVMLAPISFFDSTPLGRIINRFSKDQDSIDNGLMDSFRIFMTTFSGALITFVTIVYATPLFILPLLPVLVVYYFVQKVYRATSRELKRLDSLTRSPLYAFLGETLNGLPTIRAFGEQERFIAVSENYISRNISPSFLLFSASRWLGIRYESLGAVLVFFAAMLGIFSRTDDRFSGALLGLSLTYSLQVTQSINFCVNQFTQTEIAMNSVERVAYYGDKVEQEAPALIENNRPEKEWPVEGTIQFENVDMKYAPELPLVLQNLNFSIRHQEKVGLVGRTGSGKSSILQVLFRMTEAANGRVLIDGKVIQEIGLKDLRSVLGIIPQDPILFSGTFRRNMDPFNEHEDAEIWDALERANIKNKVVESGGLDGTVLAGGDNLSVGQRQLLCLARAMLKKPKILILDEATANVDFESDSIIQACIRKDFSHATILTIAHRLNTVIDYDRIMVLDAGKLVEFDTPSNLLKNPDGKFYSMVQETGEQNMELFKKQLGM
ncbi:hypothetical protein HK103_005829 [Boothiomyces macroporosus]|uniref:ABC transporter n=1 Tax=Boothiomyces macroporosus TaxID=261099 RepID=A0AAD5Y7H6_9FUNG|nr:hypothetical protein HK103_005829 [Boothiomyces macroporosus]